MQIIITDTNELSELDLRVLRAVVGDNYAVTVAEEKPVSKAAAKKAAPAKRAAAKPAPEPDPEPEEDEDEDLLGEDEDEAGDDEPTMADAVALATKLVSEDKAVGVKKVLTKLGAKRVSELTEDTIPEFVAQASKL